MKELYIDLTLPTNQIIKFNQYDQNLDYKIWFFESGDQRLIKGNETVYFTMIKPDKTNILYRCETNSDGSVSMTTSLQFTISAGIAKAQFTILTNSNELVDNSDIIKVVIAQSIYGDASITSSDEYQAFTIKLPDVLVTGVKGESEAYFRVGDVNLTNDDVGAMPIEYEIKSEFEPDNQREKYSWLEEY